MSEKILLLLPIGTHKPNLELTICYANNLIEQGNDLTILPSGGNRDACLDNPLGLPGSSKRCEKRTQKGLSLIKGKYQLAEMATCTLPEFNYTDMNSLKALKYLGTNIGYSALSTYATLTRSADIDFQNPKTRKVINRFLETACYLAHTAKDLQEKNQFDRFVLFNARLNTYRSFFDFALNMKIPVDVLELNFSRQNAMIFKNAMPHDISYNAQLIENLYQKMGHDQAQENAENFFNNRKQSLFSNEASYTKDQQANLLPENWDNQKHNVVIFNSSEDEFMAVGGEWEQGKLFSSQYEGLKFLSEYAKSSEMNFYLRLHPNLTGTQQSYLDMLAELQNPRFTVIPPESKISTYSLLFEGDKCITFGSSIGLEATYWGKPSILLGNCFYKHLNVTYVPKDEDELIALIERDLRPIDNKLGCIKMVNHWINPGTPVPGYSFKNGRGLVSGEKIPKVKSIMHKLESKYKKRYLRDVR